MSFLRIELRNSGIADNALNCQAIFSALQLLYVHDKLLAFIISFDQFWLEVNFTRQQNSYDRLFSVSVCFMDPTALCFDYQCAGIFISQVFLEDRKFFKLTLILWSTSRPYFHVTLHIYQFHRLKFRQISNNLPVTEAEYQ